MGDNMPDNKRLIPIEFVNAQAQMLRDETVKIMDFGIARVLGTSRMTRQGWDVARIRLAIDETYGR